MRTYACVDIYMRARVCVHAEGMDGKLLVHSSINFGIKLCRRRKKQIVHIDYIKSDIFVCYVFAALNVFTFQFSNEHFVGNRNV